MPIERLPLKPIVPGFVPKDGRAYRVKDGDDWTSVARQFGVEVGVLIEFNFGTRVPDEVNWYLRRLVGCRRPTRDGKNWMFSSDASPGIIYIPPPPPAPNRRIAHSVGSMSWIDPRLFHATELPEVDRNPPGEATDRASFLRRSGYRFANFLEGYVVADAQGAIVETDFTPDSGLYFGPSFRGIMPKAYDVIRSRTVSADGRSVHFAQTVGCKTVSPETIGAQEGARIADLLLGIHRNWGGPLGVQAEQAAADAGWKGAENIRVFPPIWTHLALTMDAEGGFDGRLVRHSMFPSVTFYVQHYAVERLTTDVTRFRQALGHDARPWMDRWRAEGWGPVHAGTGACAGNPWAVPDPRAWKGHELPPFLAPGIPDE